MAGCRAWSRIGNGSRHDRHNPGQASRPRRRTVRAEEYAPPASLGEKYAQTLQELGDTMPYATNDGMACGRRHQAADVVAVQNDLEIGAARFWSHFMGGDVALALGRLILTA